MDHRTMSLGPGLAGMIGARTIAMATFAMLAGGRPPSAWLPASRCDAPPPVHANDNRVPAGRLHDDTLELRLEVRMATWRPEADNGPAIQVAAFAEEGRAPEIPAPLIRVPAGTIIVASVRNALTDSTIALHGLVTHPSIRDDSLMLRPGASTRVTFAAGDAGTYDYRAAFGTRLHRRGVDPEQEQLAGAFAVDPPSGSPPDRILVINIWARRWTRPATGTPSPSTAAPGPIPSGSRPRSATACAGG